MENIALLLVGGFLGSGKTTAIVQAAEQLHAEDIPFGVITNDQGKKQVDSLFMKGRDIATQEVSDGCFCCRYRDLEAGLSAIVESIHPKIIFAESVGSCADLVATVINPLLRFNPGNYRIVLSVFTDIRLLMSSLLGDERLFSGNVHYIFEKQLEEADIIVINKVDLMGQEQLLSAKKLISKAFPDKLCLFQNSRSASDISEWLTVALQQASTVSTRDSLDIDYDRYGAGEADLAWLDQELGIVTRQSDCFEASWSLMNLIQEKIRYHSLPIGHLKFILDDGIEQFKISFTGTADSTAGLDFTQRKAHRLVLLINARIQASPELLQELVSSSILEIEYRLGCQITVRSLSAFQPGFPRPTHRLTR